MAYIRRLFIILFISAVGISAQDLGRQPAQRQVEPSDRLPGPNLRVHDAGDHHHLGSRPRVPRDQRLERTRLEPVMLLAADDGMVQARQNFRQAALSAAKRPLTVGAETSHDFAILGETPPAARACRTASEP